MSDITNIIKRAAMDAAIRNDAGESIKGILIYEDVFYAIMKEEPKFKGIIVTRTPKGIKEFYVRPLTEQDLERLQIVRMGSYILTAREREDQENYLASKRNNKI